MSDSLVTLLDWDRVVPWKVLSLPNLLSDDFVPIGYGSKSTVFRGRARKNSTLWVMTRPEEKAVHAPSLIARIKVEGLYTKDNCPQHLKSKGVEELLCQWGWVAVSDPTRSEFFDLNDASRPLQKLGITSFRVMRSFPNGTQKVAAAFRPCMKRARDRTLFLSYTHAESASFALELAKELLRHRFSPWLDSLAIPRYDLRPKEGPSKERLSKLIRLGIRRSHLALVVSTKEYGNTYWTRKERQWIRERWKQHGRPRCVQILNGARKLRKCDKEFETGPASVVASNIADWWRQAGEHLKT